MPPKVPQYRPNAFAVAAREIGLGVTEQELKDWLNEHVRPRLSRSMWSRWERGWKPIAAKHRYAFLRARERKPP